MSAKSLYLQDINYYHVPSSQLFVSSALTHKGGYNNMRWHIKMHIKGHDDELKRCCNKCKQAPITHIYLTYYLGLHTSDLAYQAWKCYLSAYLD